MNYLKLNGHVFKIERNYDEPTNQFMFRKYWIMNKKPSNKKELETAITESYVAKNIKFLGCKYDDKLMSYIKETIEDIYDK